VAQGEGPEFNRGPSFSCHSFMGVKCGILTPPSHSYPRSTCPPTGSPIWVLLLIPNCDIKLVAGLWAMGREVGACWALEEPVTSGSILEIRSREEMAGWPPGFQKSHHPSFSRQPRISRMVSPPEKSTSKGKTLPGSLWR
jgi:hypothetical protein